jgi:hypothetical protein
MQSAAGGADAAAARRPASFSVSYLNPPALSSSFWYAWQTMLVVLLVLGGGPVWVWRVSKRAVGVGWGHRGWVP